MTIASIQNSPLLMLRTRAGFLDLFDFIPGLPAEDTNQLMETSQEAGGLRYASLEWLERMKTLCVHNSKLTQ